MIINFRSTQKKLNFYIQPALSFRFDKYFDFTVFSKINQNRYYDLTKNLDFGDRTDLEKQDKFFNDREIASLLFFEPGFQFRIGLEKIKLQFMYSKIYDLSNTGIQYRRDNLYLGLSLRLNLRKTFKITSPNQCLI